MIQYNKSTIYKLCCKDANITEIYIGSTTNFRLRKSQHKCFCNNEKCKQYDYKVYKFIRQNGGFNNWEMIEIEKVNATDKKDLHKNERRVIEELRPVLNCRIPCQTQKEYYIENIDKIKEQKKEYRTKNIDIFKEREKEYRAKNSDKIKEREKEYRAKNSDKIKEREKEYRAKNSDKIKEQNKEKIDCECGFNITKRHIVRHKKSQKHIKYLKSLETNQQNFNLIFVE
jgi:hypothetical protein